MTEKIKKPHPHADIIKAWADGEIIEYYDGQCWHETSNPHWIITHKYRIKPKGLYIFVCKLPHTVIPTYTQICHHNNIDLIIHKNCKESFQYQFIEIDWNSDKTKTYEPKN